MLQPQSTPNLPIQYWLPYLINGTVRTVFSAREILALYKLLLAYLLIRNMQPHTGRQITLLYR